MGLRCPSREFLAWNDLDNNLHRELQRACLNDSWKHAKIGLGSSSLTGFYRDWRPVDQRSVHTSRRETCCRNLNLWTSTEREWNYRNDDACLLGVSYRCWHRLHCGLSPDILCQAFVAFCAQRAHGCTSSLSAPQCYLLPAVTSSQRRFTPDVACQEAFTTPVVMSTTALELQKGRLFTQSSVCYICSRSINAACTSTIPDNDHDKPIRLLTPERNDTLLFILVVIGDRAYTMLHIVTTVTAVTSTHCCWWCFDLAIWVMWGLLTTLDKIEISLYLKRLVLLCLRIYYSIKPSQFLSIRVIHAKVIWAYTSIHS